MDLSKILTPERIQVPIDAVDKIGVITSLVDRLHATGGLKNRDAALEAVLKREAERTTGIGYGLALPHGRSEAADELVIAAGKPASPIDFQSIDRRPVSFVVLLVSPPDQAAAHMKALAKISRLMNLDGFRAAVDRAASPADLHAAIVAFEVPETV